MSSKQLWPGRSAELLRSCHQALDNSHKLPADAAWCLPCSLHALLACGVPARLPRIHRAWSLLACHRAGTAGLNVPMFIALRRFTLLFTILLERFWLKKSHDWPTLSAMGIMIGGAVHVVKAKLGGCSLWDPVPRN